MVYWWIIIFETNRFLFGGNRFNICQTTASHCSLGEPFHTKQPDHFILRMIISLLFEPIRNSSRDHLRFAYAI